MTKSPTQNYRSPLAERYCSPEMLRLFSEDHKFLTWRDLWIALAEEEKKCGLPITHKQINLLKKTRDQIDYKKVAKIEKETRHDVMSHVKAWAEQCPEAGGIIHWGATSCFVGDNTDLIILKQALTLTLQRLRSVIENLAAFCQQEKQRPTLGFTHFQAAQLTTVGKRASLWCQDFCFDLEELESRLKSLPFRGVKGTTGTQASFLQLFGGSHKKVKDLDRNIARRFGFKESLAVTGQTYTRKLDSHVLNLLSNIAQSAHKFASDIRLLSHLKEVEEPIERGQIGSSAMAYKRNPMRSERICSLARFVMSLQSNTAQTAANQWFERTLDDSANRRLTLPEAFLTTEACLILCANISQALVVNPGMIEKHIAEELPFMATETLLMEAVKRGGDRQDLHERIRIHSRQAAIKVKQDGQSLDLIDRLKDDPAFACLADDFDKLLNPKQFIGRAPQQVTEFINRKVKPLLKRSAVWGQVQSAAVKV